MKLEDAGYVLAVAAAYDNRPPSEAMATTWAFDLGDITRDDAVEAVREHYRAHPDTWIKPGHVVEILKSSRKTAVSQSSRLEFELLRSIDPDAPDYDEQVQAALQRARSAPAEGAAIPAQQRALAPRPVTPEERVEAARRGKELASQFIAEATPYRLDPVDAPAVPENLRRAREAALAHRAHQRRLDPDRLGRAGGQVMTGILQAQQARKASS